MTTASENPARLIQILISLPFLVLGTWCLLAPGMVEQLSLTPEAKIDNRTSHILIGCFGAQAVLSGIFIFFSKFSRTTYAVYAIALMPFFWFNYHFTMVEPIFNKLMLIDLVSNLAMLVLCVIGWWMLRP